MDVWLWFAFYPHTEAALLARLAAGVPFNVAHAAGNVVLALVAGPELRRVLERYERQVPNRGGVGMKLLGDRHCRRGARDAGGLRPGQQREDGGFGDRRSRAWATLGLVAAGADTGGAAEYLARQQPATRDGPSRCWRWPAQRRATGRTICCRASARIARQARQRDDLDDPGAAAGRRAGAAGARDVAPRCPAADRAAGPGLQVARRTRTTRPPRCRRSAQRACAGSRSTAASPSSAGTRIRTAASS